MVQKHEKIIDWRGIHIYDGEKRKMIIRKYPLTDCSIKVN